MNETGGVFSVFRLCALLPSLQTTHFSLPMLFSLFVEFSRESLSEATGGFECPLSKEEVGCSTVPLATLSQQHTQTGV